MRKINIRALLTGMTGRRLVLLSTAITTVFYNLFFFAFITENVAILTVGGALIFISASTVIFLFNLCLFSFLMIFGLFIFKLFGVLITIINSVAIYYMANFNVILDRSMMENIFNSRFSEASELITLKLFVYILVFGILPSYILCRIKATQVDRKKVLVTAFFISGFSILFLYLNSSSWLWIDKYAKILGGKVLPWSYLINSVRHYSALNLSVEDQKNLPNGSFADNKKMIFVLIIGETARSNNFSLYGYSKKTNPLLESKPNVFALNNAKSCTTYTTGSLACMLSASEDIGDIEALPTYLTRHGADVIWRTNNWGEPPIKVSRYVDATELRKSCTGDKCKSDEVLLNNLSEVIYSSEKNKILIVLHTKGSHGPSYYSRYPKAFEKFTPICRFEDISKCSQQELINAYDNTIVYTDYFISRTIDVLNSIPETQSMLMYLSDHGESLGEHGLYLHGTPYMIAPDFQKDIPFIFWLSDKFIQSRKIDTTAFNQSGNYDQFNVFHSVLGAFEFKSEAYEPKKDILFNNF
tara:strand:- start:1969 stop:3546 length:1578 start_codon:yes stop_codon:yes gene_type:complete